MNLKRQGGNVARWHTIPTNKGQTVAEHSWGVAMICRELWPTDYELMEAALCHDLGEGFTGDVPWPAKTQSSTLRKELDFMENKHLDTMGAIVPLDNQQHEKLKLADMLEVLFYAIEEIEMGNQHFKEIFGRAYDYFESLNVKEKPVVLMLQYLDNKYEEITNDS